MSSLDVLPNTGQPKLGRRKNANAGTFSSSKVSRDDLGTFQDGVFQLHPTTTSATTTTTTTTSTSTASRQPRKTKPMSKSADAGTQANIISKPARSAKSSSVKHLSFAPESTLVQIRHFPPSSSPSTTYSSHAEDSASSSFDASRAHHWAGGAYANSPDPTSIPLPTFAPKSATAPAATSTFTMQASVDLRRLLNIPAPAPAQPLDATA